MTFGLVWILESNSGFFVNFSQFTVSACSYHFTCWRLLDAAHPVLKHGPRSWTCIQVEMLDSIAAWWRWWLGCLHKILPSPVEDLWWSMYVRTRKVVNYVYEEQSQRKPWWRFTLVLTCKLFTVYRYRGERLIESFSSWFPPKYPSG